MIFASGMPPRIFQSTLSVRRATDLAAMHCARLGISIHALREESDSADFISALVFSIFQSTLSVRRATCYD